MSDEKKDFYDLRAIAAEFAADSPMFRDKTAQYWYCVSTLACAQQLSVISSHLKELVTMLKQVKK